MASFSTAEVLSCGPVLLGGGPEVAVVTVPLPTALAGFYIGVVGAAF